MMPVEDPANIVSLGEGGTPLLRAERLGARVGFAELWIKDESGNPTGSFKARGLSAAVSKAKELGYTKIALPTAGNAGGAAAAYAAKAGMECHVFMPEDTPRVFRIECERYGAKVTLVAGLIDDCGRLVAERAAARGLARRLDAEGALPRRGQEDDGLRARRGLRLGAPRRDPLPDRRRHRADRHVEGLRRDGGAGLDRRRSGRGCSRSRRRAARRSRRPSPRARRPPRSSRTPTPTPRACASPRPSPTT